MITLTNEWVNAKKQLPESNKDIEIEFLDGDMAEGFYVKEDRLYYADMDTYHETEVAQWRYIDQD